MKFWDLNVKWNWNKILNLDEQLKLNVSRFLIFDLKLGIDRIINNNKFNW